MIGAVLFGWCTIHGLIWFSLAVLAITVVLFVGQVRWERRSWGQDARPVDTKPLAPTWARTPSSRPEGRHRRGASR